MWRWSRKLFKSFSNFFMLFDGVRVHFPICVHIQHVSVVRLEINQLRNQRSRINVETLTVRISEAESGDSYSTKFLDL